MRGMRASLLAAAAFAAMASAATVTKENLVDMRKAVSRLPKGSRLLKNALKRERRAARGKR